MPKLLRYEFTLPGTREPVVIYAEDEVDAINEGARFLGLSSLPANTRIRRPLADGEGLLAGPLRPRTTTAFPNEANPHEFE